MVENGQKDDSSLSSLQLYEVELDDGPQSIKCWLVLNMVNDKSTLLLEDLPSYISVKRVTKLSQAEISKLTT